jgi:pimeloyl-ACP methyl ester carboxylesterase
LALAMAIGLPAGCSSGSSAASVPPPTNSAIASAAAATSGNPTASGASGDNLERFDGRITVADLGWLRVRCAGTGSPTILLEAGGTMASMSDWGSAFPGSLAEHTTVCRYSHRGGQGSSAAPTPLTWASIVGDVDALLDGLRDQAGIEGPYVFVGWSFGGEVALGEAARYRADTKGLVILDTDFPTDFMTLCVAGGRSPSDCQAEFDGDREAKVIEADLVKSVIPMPEIPMVLVSAMRPGPDCTVEPGASGLTVEISSHQISAPDCATMFRKIADVGLADWGAIGTVHQIRVDADHDNLIRDAGVQIARLIQEFAASVQ